MEIPLDRICVRTGVLCPRCQRLVDEGVYNELDVEVMRAFLRIEKKLGDRTLRYVKTQRLDHKLVVLVDTPDGILPSWLGKELQAALDREDVTAVIVLPHTGGDIKKLIEYAVRPYRIIDITRVYSLDGSIDYVVKLPAKARGRLDPGVLAIVLELVQKRFGGRLYIEYVDVEEREEVEKVSTEELKKLLDRIDRL